jgi:hypothetical protein
MYKNLERIGVIDLLNLEKSSHYDTNEKLTQEKVYFPEMKDLESLANIIIKTNRTTVMEFGCGWSSLIFALALNDNKNTNDSAMLNYRRNNPFECHTLDESKKYLGIAKARIPKELQKNITFHQSNVSMVLWNGKIATEYEKLPLVNPDFIYIDAPSQYNVNGNINGWSTEHNDMMPMMSDILKIEHFLTPKTIIVVDGRAANARFIKCNLQRNWEYKYCQNRDQHFFVLEEEPLGKYSNQIIQDLYYKTDTWNVSDL